MRQFAELKDVTNKLIDNAISIANKEMKFKDKKIEALEKQLKVSNTNRVILAGEYAKQIGVLI